MKDKETDVGLCRVSREVGYPIIASGTRSDYWDVALWGKLES